MFCAQRLVTIASITLFALPLFAQSPGSIDTSFGQNGEVVFQPAISGTPVHRNSVLQADGKVVTLLQSPGGINLAIFARLNSDGTLDSTFGSGGYVYMTWGGAGGQTTRFAKQIAGGEERFVAVGWASCGRKNCMRLERYTSTGALDTTFGSNGVATISSVTTGGPIAVQPLDQKILINAGGGVMRLTANGSIDSTFGSNGISTVAALSGGIAVTATGQVLVCGSYVKRKNTPADLAVARLNANGSLDDGGPADTTPGDSFGIAGRVTTDFDGYADGASSVQIDAAGRIVVAGSAQMGGSATSNYNAVIVRFTANGQVDTSFGSGGKSWLDIGGRQDLFTDLDFQSDGKIVLTGEGRFAGTGAADILTARYNSDGSIDTSFGSGGWVMKDVYGQYDQAQSILVQSDAACMCERIIVVGAGSISSNTFQTIAFRYYE